MTSPTMRMARIAAVDSLAGSTVAKMATAMTARPPSGLANALLIGALDPLGRRDAIHAYATAGLEALAMEWMPRISRAQSMDVLSSQANIAGYKAVILAANEYGRFMPMLMTAAGTVKAARVLIMGVGVAGLQAIATAKRLGAVIEASDVRPAGGCDPRRAAVSPSHAQITAACASGPRLAHGSDRGEGRAGGQGGGVPERGIAGTETTMGAGRRRRG